MFVGAVELFIVNLLSTAVGRKELPCSDVHKCFAGRQIYFSWVSHTVVPFIRPSLLFLSLRFLCKPFLLLPVYANLSSALIHIIYRKSRVYHSKNTAYQILNDRLYVFGRLFYDISALNGG